MLCPVPLGAFRVVPSGTFGVVGAGLTAGFVGVAAGLVGAGATAGFVGVATGLTGAGVTTGLTGVGAGVGLTGVGLVGAGVTTGFTGAGLTGVGAGVGLTGVGAGVGLVGAGVGLVGTGAGVGVTGPPMGRGLAGTTGLGFVVCANASAPNTTRPASKPRATTLGRWLEPVRLSVGNRVFIRAARLRRRALARFIVSPRRLYGLFQNLETRRAEFLRSQYRGRLALDLVAGR